MVITKLQNNKKSLKMMNSETQLLDYISPIGKSNSDHHSLGYQHGKDSNS